MLGFQQSWHTVLPDQGWNPCPLHSQADYYPLYHQGSPYFAHLYVNCLTSLVYLVIDQINMAKRRQKKDNYLIQKQCRIIEEGYEPSTRLLLQNSLMSFTSYIQIITMSCLFQLLSSNTIIFALPPFFFGCTVPCRDLSPQPKQNQAPCRSRFLASGPPRVPNTALFKVSTSSIPGCLLPAL